MEMELYEIVLGASNQIVDGLRVQISRDAATVSNVSSVVELTNDKSFKLFPNPAEDVLNIQMDSETNFDYKLIDITGKTILKGSALQNTLIDVNAVPSGIYLIEINEENGEKSNFNIQIK